MFLLKCAHVLFCRLISHVKYLTNCYSRTRAKCKGFWQKETDIIYHCFLICCTLVKFISCKFITRFNSIAVYQNSSWFNARQLTFMILMWLGKTFYSCSIFLVLCHLVTSNRILLVLFVQKLIACKENQILNNQLQS